MFDIVIQPQVTEFNGSNILLACLAGHLTIFAFGYPYIYRAINNLSNISSILTDRIKNNCWRKLYSYFIITTFILNLSLLFMAQIKGCSIFSCITLLLHIFYIMYLYKIIENVSIDPFESVINKNIHEQDSKIDFAKDFENDVSLIIDLICYATKNTFSEPNLKKYFTWLVDASFHSYKNYNIKKFDSLLGIMPEDQEIMFLVLTKIQWLNQWATNEKKTIILEWINNYYDLLLWYGIQLPDKSNIEAHPLLNSIENNNILDENYEKATDNIIKIQIQNKYNLIKRIQEHTLNVIKYSLLYRIEEGFTSYNEMFYFKEWLYYVIAYKLSIQVKDKYEPCFSVISSLIDHNMLEDNYNKLFALIKKHHDYFWGKPEIYNNICAFHIVVMAYLIFRNQYQLLNVYLYEEEPKDRANQNTRPQIPNSINSILLHFIGHNSVFNHTQIFASNTSSYKYKFYILFLLLKYSKFFADKNKQILSKIKKEDWRYEIVQKDILYHSKCTIDFKNINFDILMSYLNIEKYKDYLKTFKEEKELLKIFEFNKEDELFIKEVLDDTIKQLKQEQNCLTKCQFESIAVKEFSESKQKELGVKNLDELIKSKISCLTDIIKQISFEGNEENLPCKISLILYEKDLHKGKILSGGYSYLFETEPRKTFLSKLFTLILENCQELKDIKELPSSIEKYEILSNFEYRKQFEKFGFDKTNIKLKKTKINGIITDEHEYAEVASIRVNDKEVQISKNNIIFHFFNFNETNSQIIIFFNPEKISIEIKDEKPVSYIDIARKKVKIIDETQILISLANDKSLGYYIIKK